MTNFSSEQKPVRELSPEIELTQTYGNHTLAFLGLAPENQHFLAPENGGIVNYRLVGRVAVVLGDPVCHPSELKQVICGFLAFCQTQHWSIAFYQARSEYLPTYRSFGLHAFKIGEEAFLDPQTFTLTGSALANVRTTCRRARREGLQTKWYEGVLPPTVISQLESVSSAWLTQKGGQQAEETGFSTGKLDEILSNARQAECIAHSAGTPSDTLPRFVTGVATTSSGLVCAFVTFTPIYGVKNNNENGCQYGWALDLMRRAPDTPPGTIELLLVDAIERFRVLKASKLSLGLVALADTRKEFSSSYQRLLNIAAHHLKFFKRTKTLFAFKQKFQPGWESCYLVTNLTYTLPEVILAILHLRNYSGKGPIKMLASWIAGKKPRTSKDTGNWKSTCWQGLRYCLVGGINTAIDICILNVLLWCFPLRSVLLLTAYNSIAYLSGAASSFLLNKYWTFRHKQKATRKEVGRFAINLALEILTSNALLWLAGLILAPLIPNVFLWGNTAKLIAVAGNTVFSYLCMRFWVFSD